MPNGPKFITLTDLFARAIAKRVRLGAIAAADAEQALSIVGFSAAGARGVLEGFAP